MNGYDYIYPHHDSGLYVVDAWHKRTNRWFQYRIEADSAKIARAKVLAMLGAGDRILRVSAA